MVSLAIICSLSPTLAYGGHGQPIDDLEEIFHRYIRAIDERQQRVISLVPKAGTTAYELARPLVPRFDRRRCDRFLAISEAIAHLDYAETEGKLAVELSGGVEYDRPN